MNVICNYCGKPAEYVDSTVVYGSSYGMIYYCKPCNAWVGVHKGSGAPLGTLANAELRAYRRKECFQEGQEDSSYHELS